MLAICTLKLYNDFVVFPLLIKLYLIFIIKGYFYEREREKHYYNKSTRQKRTMRKMAVGMEICIECSLMELKHENICFDNFIIVNLQIACLPYITQHSDDECFS